MSDTCAGCKFCAVDYGNVKFGHCFGLPPQQFQDGRHSASQTQAPRVDLVRRACTLFQSTNGASNMVTKSHETMSNAYKGAHREMPAPVPAFVPVVLPKPGPARKASKNDF